MQAEICGCHDSRSLASLQDAILLWMGNPGGGARGSVLTAGYKLASLRLNGKSSASPNSFALRLTDMRQAGSTARIAGRPASALHAAIRLEWEPDSFDYAPGSLTFASETNFAGRCRVQPISRRDRVGAVSETLATVTPVWQLWKNRLRR